MPMTPVLLSRRDVSIAIGYCDAIISALLEAGLLESPRCEDGLFWRRVAILQFNLRRAYDPLFADAVADVAAIYAPPGA